MSELKKVILTGMFAEWLSKGRPPLWVKGKGNEKWVKVHPDYLIWDEAYDYSFSNINKPDDELGDEYRYPQPHPGRVEPFRVLYQRTMLYKNVQTGESFCKTMETPTPLKFEPNGQLSWNHRFIRWLDRWMEVRK